jgi:tetratricopeptide (TPR) repeat protein
VVSSSPEEDQVWHRREAKEAETTGQWFAAIWHLDRLIAAQPADGLRRLHRGRAYAELGQQEQAFADYTKAAGLTPDSQEGWFNRARAHAELGQYDRAFADYSKALDLGPRNAVIWLSRSLASSQLGQEDEAADAYAQAVEHSKVIRLQINTLWTGRVRSDEASHLPLWKEVVADFTTTLDKGAANWWLWRGRGLAHAALGQWDKAANDFTKASERKRDDAHTWLGLGRANAELGEWDKATAAWSKALTLKSDVWDAWFLRGFVLDQLRHQYAAAVTDYSKTIELGIDTSLLRYRRGCAYAELGQWEKAAADFAKVPWKELDAQHPPVWHQHALALLAAGDRDSYRHTCARLLERFSQTGDPNTANSVAWTCALCPGAVPAFDKCIRLVEMAIVHHRNYAYLNTLGAILYRAGHYEAAIQKLNETIKAHGKDGTAGDWLFLAMAQQRLGQAEEARRSLDKSVRWIEQAQQGKIQDEHIRLPLSWEERLEFQMLRREAEDLIQGRIPGFFAYRPENHQSRLTVE